jgi:PEP-CTERM motif
MMRPNKLTALAIIAVASLVMELRPTQAGLIPNGSPLSSLLSPGMFMDVDGFRFEDFSLAPQPPTTFQPHPDDITVTLSHNPQTRKVNFILTIAGDNRILRPGESYDMRLQFNVHAPEDIYFNQHRLDITGGVDGPGEVGVFESVESMGPPPQTLANLSTVIFDDFAKLVDTRNIPPSNWIHIRKDIGVSGGPTPPKSAPPNGDFAALTDIGQQFMYGEIPEPGTLWLAATGVLIACRRKQWPGPA